ncbi:hypothetical protein IGI39_003417 [Enterococcus sp. AZ135]|uniref:DeoR/GlpR family DNA-binding transcription regulator n=1 Tax=unclassified Enterococcus TaxID=2608891 RepID=UPI003F25B403
MDTNREKQLLTLLSEKKYVSIEKLSEFLFVSESTVRRDIHSLVEKGLVQKHKGGVSLLTVTEIEATSEFKRSQHYEEKRKIAQSAIDFVGNRQLIFLDASSTSYYLALEIAKLDRLVGTRIVTTNLSSAISLSENENIEVYLPPGKMFSKRESLHGSQTCEYLSTYYFDVVFSSCRGIDTGFGFSEFTPEEALVKRVVGNQTTQIVALADHSKFGTTFPFQSFIPEQIDFLLTDAPVAKEFEHFFLEKEIEVISLSQ